MTTLDNLKTAARRWLKALRAGDAAARTRLRLAHPSAPETPGLRDVQHALARERGYVGWAALKAAALEGTSSQHAELDGRERVATFLRFACWDHHVHGRGDHAMHEAAAMRWLRRYPDLAGDSLFTSIVCGDLAAVERTISAEPHLANERGGPRGWTPLLYLTYARLPLPAVRDNALAIANALLDRGADPNAYYMAGDSPYTPLVGVAGEGEQDAVPHLRRDELYRLLLERGAGPYDLQVVYDTHFRGDVLWWLELTYAQSVRSGRKADWDDPDWRMFDMGSYGGGARFLLDLAIQHRNEGLAAWLLGHGANPNAAPARDIRFPQRSLYEGAVASGQTALAAMLLAHGARPIAPALSDEEVFVAACLRLDRRDVTDRLAAHPEFLRSPKALFAAAERDRADVVAMLLDLGTPIEVEDYSKQRALHVAADHGAQRVAALLLERGAEPDPVETRWAATPMGFASYGNDVAMIDLLSRVSRNVWLLASRGKVDRLREVLSSEPDRARDAKADGVTPLWWLPDDEPAAAEIVDLLVAAGADPGARSTDGTTAADHARKRALEEAARRIETHQSKGSSPARRAGIPEAPDVALFERLARDVMLAHETGDPESMARLSAFVGHDLTWDELRSVLLRRLEAISGRKPDTTFIGPDEARLLVARHAGFADWAALVATTGRGA